MSLVTSAPSGNPALYEGSDSIPPGYYRHLIVEKHPRCQQVVDSSRSQVGAKTLTVEVELPDHDCRIKGVESLLTSRYQTWSTMLSSSAIRVAVSGCVVTETGKISCWRWMTRVRASIQARSSTSNVYASPSPSHSVHIPRGLLKLKSCGLGGSKLIPQLVQA